MEAKITKPKGKLDCLLDGVGIKLIPAWKRRKPSQSHARGTMHEIRNYHGDDYLVYVLKCIRSVKHNRDELWSETIGAIADAVAQTKDWQDRKPEIVEAIGSIRLGTIRGSAIKLRPWPVRMTMRVLIHAEIDRALNAEQD